MDSALRSSGRPHDQSDLPFRTIVFPVQTSLVCCHFMYLNLPRPLAFTARL